MRRPPAVWLWGAAGAFAFKLVLVGAAVAVGCGGAGGDARFPRRSEGCDVLLFHEAPNLPTENIGTVRSRCADDVAESDCVRELKDQVCALGGDVVWGVGDPEKRDGKLVFQGRAAHTAGPKVHPGARP